PGVVRHVVDDEARVERQPVVQDRVRVSAGAVVALEELDLVCARQQIGRAQAGDSRSHHRNPHLHRYSKQVGCRLSTYTGFSMEQTAATIRIRTVRERTSFWSRVAG